MIANTFVAVVLASSLACFVTTIGIYVIGKFEEWGRRNTVYFMSFAAGVLVSVSFIHIIPRSFEMHPSAPVFLLAGFLILYFFNRFLNLYICQEYLCESYSVRSFPTLSSRILSDRRWAYCLPFPQERCFTSGLPICYPKWRKRTGDTALSLWLLVYWLRRLS